MFSFSLAKYLRVIFVKLLDHTVVLFLIFWRTSMEATWVSCPSTDEWIKMMWCVCVCVCVCVCIHSAVKKGMNFCHLQQHKWTWRILCLGKCQRKINTVRFQLHMESKNKNKQTKEKQTHKYWEQTSGYRGEKGGGGHHRWRGSRGTNH